MGTDQVRSVPEGGRRRSRALELWLQHEHLSAEERINRLAGDAEVVADLEAAGFRGREWEFLARVLAEYGISIIAGWMRRDVIRDELARKQIRAPNLPPHVMQNRDASTEIAVMTVGDALRVFQADVLPKGKWRPNGGAALSTYFIGQCLFRYGNAVQQWQRNNKADQESTDPGDLDGLAAEQCKRATASDVEEDLVRDESARLAVRDAGSTHAARARAMDLLGYSNQEIALDLGISRKAVSSLLERERARARVSAQRPSIRKGSA